METFGIKLADSFIEEIYLNRKLETHIFFIPNVAILKPNQNLSNIILGSYLIIYRICAIKLKF
jgi:hypothetical protein